MSRVYNQRTHSSDTSVATTQKPTQPTSPFPPGRPHTSIARVRIITTSLRRIIHWVGRTPRLTQRASSSDSLAFRRLDGFSCFGLLCFFPVQITFQSRLTSSAARTMASFRHGIRNPSFARRSHLLCIEFAMATYILFTESFSLLAGWSPVHAFSFFELCVAQPVGVGCLFRGHALRGAGAVVGCVEFRLRLLLGVFLRGVAGGCVCLRCGGLRGAFGVERCHGVSVAMFTVVGVWRLEGCNFWKGQKIGFGGFGFASFWGVGTSRRTREEELRGWKDVLRVVWLLRRCYDVCGADPVIHSSPPPPTSMPCLGRSCEDAGE